MARYLVLVVAGALALTAIVMLSPTNTSSMDGGIEEGQDSLHECETRCRQEFGGDEWIAPPVRGGAMIAYSNCILKCEREFWKDYDKD